MNKQEVYRLLQDSGLWHEITEHPAIFSMAEVAKISILYPEVDVKKLLVRDDKKWNCYLIYGAWRQAR